MEVLSLGSQKGFHTLLADFAATWRSYLLGKLPASWKSRFILQEKLRDVWVLHHEHKCL